MNSFQLKMEELKRLTSPSKNPKNDTPEKNVKNESIVKKSPHLMHLRSKAKAPIHRDSRGDLFLSPNVILLFLFVIFF